MSGTIELHTDAIAQDMLVIQQAMDRIAFNSQQIIEHLENNPPPEMTPVMATEDAVVASREHGRHDVRMTIAKRMREAIERAAKQVRHCVAHCEAAIEILKGI